MASANTSGLLFSTNKPLCLSIMISEGPEAQLTDITGVPKDRLSISMVGNPSYLLVSTVHIALRTIG